MKAYYVTFRSVTFAQRAEAVLLRAGIPCTLQRTPRWMEAQGCGYCLRISVTRGWEAVTMLRSEQVNFRRVYLKDESGKVEEMAV